MHGAASAPHPAPGHRETPGRRLAAARRAARNSVQLTGTSSGSAEPGQGLRKPARRRPRGREGSVCASWRVERLPLSQPCGSGRGATGVPAVARLRERAPLSSRSPRRPPVPVLCAREPGPGAIRGPDLAGRRKGTELPALGRGPPRWAVLSAGAGCSVSPSAVLPFVPPFGELCSQRRHVDPSPPGASVATTRGVRTWPRGGTPAIASPGPGAGCALARWCPGSGCVWPRSVP